MDAQRAQQICDSSNMEHVTYNGQRIYIEHVDQQNNTASIHMLDNPDQKQSVTVDSLVEQK